MSSKLIYLCQEHHLKTKAENQQIHELVNDAKNCNLLSGFTMYTWDEFKTQLEALGNNTNQNDALNFIKNLTKSPNDNGESYFIVFFF